VYCSKAFDKAHIEMAYNIRVDGRAVHADTGAAEPTLADVMKMDARG